MDDDLVTVVIPARDEEAAISECIRSVLAQDWHMLQVVVVDGASTDATADIVSAIAFEDARVELVSNPAGVIPVSLNLALGRARGRWLVRVDAHSRIPASYISTVVRHLATGSWGGVGGRKEATGTTSAGRAIAAALSSPFGVGNSTYHYGTKQQTVEHIPFGAYPTELARQLGGWHEQLSVNEDFEFDFRLRRAGHKLLFDPTLIIHWQARESITDLFRQYWRYGAGKANVVWLHPASLRLRHLAAPALVVSWVGAGLVAMKRPKLALLSLAPYGIAVIAAWLKTLYKLRGPKERAWVPAAFVAMHTGWGLGFWVGLTRLAHSGPKRPRRSRHPVVSRR